MIALLKNISFFAILICMVAVTGCHSIKALGLSNPDFIENYQPVSLKYDTVEADFLNEINVDVYRSGCLMMKSGGYVKEDKVKRASYYNGYYILNLSDLTKFSKEIPGFHYDSLSIWTEYANSALEHRPTIDFYCEVQYARAHLKLEVLQLGMVRQRLPVLQSCEELRRSEGKGYYYASIPTYLITGVLETQKVEP